MLLLCGLVATEDADVSTLVRLYPSALDVSIVSSRNFSKDSQTTSVPLSGRRTEDNDTPAFSAVIIPTASG